MRNNSLFTLLQCSILILLCRSFFLTYPPFYKFVDEKIVFFFKGKVLFFIQNVSKLYFFLINKEYIIMLVLIYSNEF